MHVQGRRLGRGQLASLLIAALVAAMVPLVAGGTQATAAGSTNKTVLSSEFGKAKSHIEGTFGRNGTVRGTFTPREFFVNDNDRLIAVGKVRAVARNGQGEVVEKGIKRGVRMPVTRAEGAALRAPGDSCQILNLVLGPLDVNLLGLEVHLNRVVLNIVATPGPGNLLGNLLCAVAGLLDGGLDGVLNSVARILNSILALLRL